MEYELIRHGTRLRYLGTDALTWRDLYVIVRNLPDDNAIHRSLLSEEQRRWGMADATGVVTQLLALAVEGINDLIWQGSEDGHKNRNRPRRLPRPGVTPDTPTRDELDEYDTWYAQRFNAHNN